MYLWVNVADLDTMGTIGPLGSPLNLMVRQDLGDTLLPGGVFNRGRIDEIFVIVECTQERATAIKECLEVMSKVKIKRALRTRITENPPNGKWQVVSK